MNQNIQNQFLMNQSQRETSTNQCKKGLSQLKPIQKFISELDRNILQRYPDLCYLDDKNQLIIKDIEQIETERQLSGSQTEKIGRGGNSAGQNFKKLLRSILIKVLKDDQKDFHQRYFIRYSMKSQKENFFLIFLFLDQFVRLKELNSNIINEVIRICRQKTMKRIKTSERRIDQRKSYHQKNIRELKKYLNFNLNYSKNFSWEELEKDIHFLFLRKKINAKKAAERVKKIIMNHKILNELFPDLARSEKNIKEEDLNIKEKSM